MKQEVGLTETPRLVCISGIGNSQLHNGVARLLVHLDVLIAYYLYSNEIFLSDANKDLTHQLGGGGNWSASWPASQNSAVHKLNARTDDMQSGQTLLPHSARNLDEFALEVKAALDSHPLDVRPVEYVFSDNAPFNPTCDGIWAEFGVATGELIRT